MRLFLGALAWVLWSATAWADVVLVAGASGGTGRYLIEQLLAQGYEVRGLTRNPADAKLRTGLDIEWVAGDVRNPDSLSGIMGGVD